MDSIYLCALLWQWCLWLGVLPFYVLFCWAFVLCFWMHKKQRESGRAGGKGKNMIKMYRMKNLTNKSVINKVHGHTKKTM